jgi:hypothetical protein
MHFPHVEFVASTLTRAKPKRLSTVTLVKALLLITPVFVARWPLRVSLFFMLFPRCGVIGYSKNSTDLNSPLFENSTLRQRNLVLTGRSVQSPSSLPPPMCSNHVPHYHRSHNSQFATVFHPPASLNASQLSPSTHIIIVVFFDGQAKSPEGHKP